MEINCKKVNGETGFIPNLTTSLVLNNVTAYCNIAKTLCAVRSPYTQKLQHGHIMLKKGVALLTLTIMCCLVVPFAHSASGKGKHASERTLGEFCQEDFEFQADMIAAWVRSVTSPNIIKGVSEQEGNHALSDICDCLLGICKKGGGHLNLGQAAAICLTSEKKRHPWIGDK